MRYYVTVKHHSIIGSWEELPARSLTHAKRLATNRHGQGYIGHVIHLVECPEADYKSGHIEDMPQHRKTIGTKKWTAYDY